MEENELACNCSGIRSCLVCRKDRLDLRDQKEEESTPSWLLWYCPSCAKLYEGDITRSLGKKKDTTSEGDAPTTNWCVFHEGCSPSEMMIAGIHVDLFFVDGVEESFLVEAIDKEAWKLSQSGRRKQDFGPKANFKKRKVKLGQFNGFPPYAEFLVERFEKHVPCLSDFFPVELCNLEYTCERGSSIDPHLDDTWLWGEQLVTLNLLDTTILTLSKPEDGGINEEQFCEVQIPLVRRSLLVLSGDARYLWLHAIKRKDIRSRRMAMTFRNLSNEIVKDTGNRLIVEELRNISKSFAGTVVL